MRFSQVSSILALVAVLLLATSCRQTLSIEEAHPACPPELPDCTRCEQTEDCGPGAECHAWTCKDSVCTPINAEPRTDCSTGVCSDDSVSACIACLADEDCPSGETCREDRTCSAP